MGGVKDFNEIKNKCERTNLYKCNEKGDKINSEWVEKLAALMLDLREFVHHLNRTPALAYRNGIYQAMDREAVHMTAWDGWEIGYKIRDLGAGFLQRNVFLKCEQDLDTVPEEESNPVIETALHVFMDVGSAPPDIEPIYSDCMMMAQIFAVAFLSEKNPNLVNHKGCI